MPSATNDTNGEITKALLEELRAKSDEPRHEKTVFYICENKDADQLLSIYLQLLSRSITDHHLRCGGWLNFEFSKRGKTFGMGH